MSSANCVELFTVTAAGTLQGKYCGEGTGFAGEEFLYQGPVVIEWKSDGGVNNIGFRIEYEVISADPCANVQCQNGGTCDEGMCLCLAGFEGELCQENVDDCIDVSCNNGSCVDGLNEFYCDCFSGFTGY